MTADQTPARRTAVKKAPPSVAARQAEAEEGYVFIEQCGIELRLPVGDRTEIEALDLIRDGDHYGALRVIVGEQQWKKLKDVHATRADILELNTKMQEAMGN